MSATQWHTSPESTDWKFKVYTITAAKFDTANYLQQKVILEKRLRAVMVSLYAATCLKIDYAVTKYRLNYMRMRSSMSLSLRPESLAEVYNTHTFIYHLHTLLKYGDVETSTSWCVYMHAILATISVTMHLCPTVRADITGIRTVPDSPIEGTDTRCLSAGKDVDIVCDNLAFPVATVLFFKDGTEIDVEADERCV